MTQFFLDLFSVAVPIAVLIGIGVLINTWGLK